MSEMIYRAKILNLRVDTVELENGRTARFEVVEHGDSIGVLPVTDAGTALLVKQYRHAIGETLLEIVAGNADAGENHEQAALRELSEEVGHRAREIVPLGGIYLCP